MSEPKPGAEDLEHGSGVKLRLPSPEQHVLFFSRMHAPYCTALEYSTQPKPQNVKEQPSLTIQTYRLWLHTH